MIQTFRDGTLGYGGSQPAPGRLGTREEERHLASGGRTSENSIFLGTSVNKGKREGWLFDLLVNGRTHDGSESAF